MTDSFYRIILLDHSTASFITMPRTYYGTKEDILAVVHDEHFYSSKLMDFTENYFAGKNDGNIEGIPWIIGRSFIAPVEVLGERTAEASTIHVKHTNIWGYESDEYASHASVRHVYIRDEGKLRRCTQISMTDLWYDISDNPRTPRPVKISTLFGHPGVMVYTEPNVIENRLLYTDTYFGCIEELEADMKFPGGTDYSLFMDEIMGDG